MALFFLEQKEIYNIPLKIPCDFYKLIKSYAFQKNSNEAKNRTIKNSACGCDSGFTSPLQISNFENLIESHGSKVITVSCVFFDSLYNLVKIISHHNYHIFLYHTLRLIDSHNLLGSLYLLNAPHDTWRCMKPWYTIAWKRDSDIYRCTLTQVLFIGHQISDDLMSLV